MRRSLFLTLLDYKRIPDYISSLVYAAGTGILKMRSRIYGMISIPECVTLHKLAIGLPNNSVALEIGSYGGLSSAYLLSGLEKKNSFLYSVDPFGTNIETQKKIVGKYNNTDYREAEYASLRRKPTKSEVSGALKNLGFSNFKLIEGYSFDVIKRWNKKIDLLFIDGNHEYGAVKRDFLEWTKYLKKGGVVILHDANNLNYLPKWNWGLEGPTKVASAFINPPKWLNIGRVDSAVYATKNY
jgi:predicted O-methyltransferase YrrM